MADTKRCEWCAEEILAEARKCKHCGELVGTTPPVVVQAVSKAAQVAPCGHCGYQPTSSRDAFLHEANVHTGRSATGVMANSSASGSKAPKGRSNQPPALGRPKLSQVGNATAGGLACPNCGGTQYTAKRSKKGKVIGFATLGVGGLIAPKSQVKCVSCGKMFKRG